MSRNVYRFAFSRAVPLAEAELSLQLAILAAEGLFGAARVRMDLSYRVIGDRRSVMLSCDSRVAEAVVRILTAFLLREYGADKFQVERNGTIRHPGATGQCPPAGTRRTRHPAAPMSRPVARRGAESMA